MSQDQDNQFAARPHRTRETPSISLHAQLRLSQRNISERDFAFVLKYGHIEHNTGILYYVLRRRDIPPEYRRHSSIARLEGTAILVSRDGTVITVIRNRRYFRAIVRKGKQRTEKQRIDVHIDVHQESHRDGQTPAQED